MEKLVIFLLGSCGLVIFSRHALSRPSSHGFPRFFAFEAILGLVVLNVPFWFVTPFAVPQLVSWVLLVLSAYLVIHSIYTLRRYGLQDRSIPDASRLSFEKTTRLVTNGPYRLIRHPMYASLLYLAWAVFFKHVAPYSALLVIVASLALLATALLEEKENLRNFGETYAAYKQHTKRFIPFVF